jgi:pyruvate dehydrogenase E2 component (dihydrolipoamide acetyltransferase)
MALEKEVVVPDIGGFNDVEVIEVLVKPGDQVKADESLITLESDKAAMEIPAPFSGTVKQLKIATGGKVSKGSPILTMEVAEEPAKNKKPPDFEASRDEAEAPPELKKPEPQPSERPEDKAAPPPPAVEAPSVPEEVAQAGETPHASPSVRRFARELGADLSRIRGSGRKGRVLKEDVQAFVKANLQKAEKSTGALALPELPEIDFSQFGAIETQPLSRIKKLTAVNLHRSWITIPHVTQHDEADITELESFRQSLKAEAETQGVKLTFLPLLVKAVVATLKTFPSFNASLANGGEALVIKKYYHIGVAVDTVEGLVVPVIRDADKKGVLELAKELADTSARTRSKRLKNTELQGASFSISSLGGISGTAFTPIINPPEVAILGVSRAKTQPVYQDGQFVPRLMLPFSLSYDHRVIDGAEAARFCAHLGKLLQDLRRVLM